MAGAIICFALALACGLLSGMLFDSALQRADPINLSEHILMATLAIMAAVLLVGGFVCAYLRHLILD